MKQIDKIKKFQRMEEHARLKHIAVSEDNYLQLKEFGKFGDTFNDVVTVLLEKKKKSDSIIPEQKSDFHQS